MDSSSGACSQSKRKRKKSFIQKAKKFGRSGQFGRGSHISEDVYQYFVRVLEMSRQEFASDDDRVVFINNVFDETVGEEINLSCNQLVSRAIENLLPSASDEVIDRFTDAFTKDLRPIFGDPFASHVLQKLLLIVAKKTKDSLKKDLESVDDKSNINKEDWVVRVGRFGLNNIEDFTWDMYANHVLRTVLLCISGGNESENVNAGKGGVLTPKIMENIKCENDLPKAYIELLKDYLQSLASWPQIAELAFEGLTSGLLQSLLFALKRAGKTELCDHLVKILIKECFKKYGNNEKELFESDYALHLLDSSLATVSTDVFRQIHESCLKGKIQDLAVHPKSNFTIQRLFDFTPEKNLLEEYFAEIQEAENGMETIFSCRYFGVLSSIAKACKRLGHKQGIFMKIFMKVLVCDQPNERHLKFVPLVTQMMTYDTLFGDEKKDKSSSQNQHIDLHGSLIVQAMLHFNKPIKVVDSMLDMSPSELQQIFCDPKGSHIMDAFMESVYVGAKSRERLIKKLMGTFVSMSTCKHGSRSFEAAWAVMTIKLRENVAAELSAREGNITSNKFGQIIAANIALPLFRRNIDDWLQFQSGQQKKLELFADIIGNSSKSTEVLTPIRKDN